MQVDKDQNEKYVFKTLIVFAQKVYKLNIFLNLIPHVKLHYTGRTVFYS